MVDNDSMDNAGVPVLPVGVITREFETSFPLVFPPGTWGAKLDKESARCALITRFSARIMPRRPRRGDIFFSATLRPGEIGHLSLPGGAVSKEGGHLSPEGVLDHVSRVFEAPAGADLHAPIEDAGKDVLSGMPETVASAFLEQFQEFAGRAIATVTDKNTRVEEVSNPNKDACLSLFFHRVVQDVTLVISVADFLLEIADKDSRARVFPEELGQVAARYFAMDNPRVKEVLSQVASVLEDTIAYARDYRRRVFPGLARRDYTRPYAFLASGLLDEEDAAIDLDRSVITGCVVVVRILPFPVPGYFTTCSVGLDCRSGHDRLAQGAE